MATLEAATLELQNLNGIEDSQLDAMFEQSSSIDHLADNVLQINTTLLDILDVMQDFIGQVPREIAKGYADLIDFQQTQALLEAREKDGEGEGDGDDGKGDGKKDGFFKSNFKKGMEKDLGIISALKDNIAEVIVVAGSVASAFSGSFGLIIKAMKGLVGIAGTIGKLLLPIVGKLALLLKTAFVSIGAPFLAVAAAIGALVLGVQQAIKDFQGEEGTFVDKLIAGIGGFVKGVMQLITIPLDILKDGIAWVAGALGFEDFEKMLDGFSFTEGFSDLVDIAVDFLQGIKDWIANKFKGAVNSVGEFFGLDPIFEDKPEAPKAGSSESTSSEAVSSGSASSEAVSSGSASSDAKSISPTTADSPAAQKVASVSGANNSASGSGEGSPEKVKIPEGVRVTPAGKYASYNKETNSQAFFSSVKDAVTFMNAPIAEAAKMDPYAAEVYEESKKENAAREASKQKMLARLKSKSESPVVQAPILNAVSAPQSKLEAGAPASVNVERPPGTIVGVGERIALSNSVAVENNKLEEKKAEMNQSSASNAVVSANNNSTNISSATYNHNMPSATDKSDRTDRRGSFRGA